MKKKNNNKENKRRSKKSNDKEGLTDDEYETLKEDIRQGIEEGNRKYGYGTRKKPIEILSVEQLQRKHSGYYGVVGMIVGISSVEHVVMSTEFKCSNCNNGTLNLAHDPPLFSLPYHLNLDKTRKCPLCNSLSFGPKSHREKAIVRIQLQDEQKQNNLENLTCILFENDTFNIRNVEKVYVAGHVKVIQQRSQNSKRVTYLFAEEGTLRYKTAENMQVIISKRDLQLMNKFVKQPDYIEKITKMVAPRIIGEFTKKLGVIIMHVGAPEKEDFRGRIHGLFVGTPGTAKSKLAWQAKKIGDPNSRYTSAEGSSAQSLGVIIDREGDSFVLRSGILVQAKDSMAVLNEVASFSQDDQKHLLSVMEEGIIPKDKYGMHREIEAKTTILGTLNPRMIDWYQGIINKEQIPLRRELVDRYDLIFVFKDITDRKEKEEYARKKIGIVQDIFDDDNNDSSADYTLLRKIIKHAKTFKSTKFSEEANAMMIEFYSSLDSQTFPTKRVLDVVIRTCIAFARLHFSEEVTAEIAKKALSFLTDVFKEFDSSIVVVDDPREIICKEIATFYMQKPNVLYDFTDAIEIVKTKSSILEGYFGDGKGLDTQSHKYRDLKDRFLESPPVAQGLIIVESQNPLRLMFKVENQ